MRGEDFDNFESTIPLAVDRILDRMDRVMDTVRDEPFTYTLIELGDMFGMPSEDVRAVLHSTGEALTPIPLQDGQRHVWGYADEAHQEWEYLRRRTGQTISHIRAIQSRMNAVMDEYGAPKSPVALRVAELICDLYMTLLDAEEDETDD